MDSSLCAYHFVIWSNFNFLYNSLWITFLTQLYLDLYSFWACLLHSLIMWLIIIILLLWVFHTSFSWWFFTGVWVTASLLKSLWLFFSILADLSNAALLFLAVILPFLWGLFQVHQILFTTLEDYWIKRVNLWIVAVRKQTFACQPALVHPSVEVYWRTSFMRFSLLLLYVILGWFAR